MKEVLISLDFDRCCNDDKKNYRLTRASTPPGILWLVCEPSGKQVGLLRTHKLNSLVVGPVSRWIKILLIDVKDALF